MGALRNIDITACSLRWDCNNEFQRQCHPQLAEGVGDCLEQVMVAQVLHCSCLLSEIRKAVSI